MIKGEGAFLEYGFKVTRSSVEVLDIPPGVVPARIVVTVETASIRYRYSGVDPLPGVGGGHPVESGGTIIIEGSKNIENFKMIGQKFINANVFITLEVL